MIIGTRWHVDKYYFGVTNISHNMVHIRRDNHEATVALGQENLVDHLVRRRVSAVVIQDNLGGATAEKQAIRLELMHRPALDLVGANDHLIDIHQWLVG